VDVSLSILGQSVKALRTKTEPTKDEQKELVKLQKELNVLNKQAVDDNDKLDKLKTGLAEREQGAGLEPLPPPSPPIPPRDGGAVNPRKARQLLPEGKTDTKKLEELKAGLDPRVRKLQALGREQLLLRAEAAATKEMEEAKLAEGDTVIKFPSPLNVLKDAYDYSCH
jgi:molybdopterin converting factor small subunit